MLIVKPVTRETIDQWTLAESGLPVRVCNSMRAAGVLRVGELRRWSDAEILRLRSLGHISLGHIHDFFALCHRIEKGEQAFENIKEVLDIFLDEDEFAVISSRYGFQRESLRVSRKCMTLEEIGRQADKTRERIRQIEATAKHKLSSRLGSVCLQPFYDYFRSILESLGQTAPSAQITPLADRMITAGYNPGGVLLLLCDLAPTRLTFYNQFFSLLPGPKLQDLERQALAALERWTAPVPLEDVLQALSRDTPAGFSESLRKTVMVLLEHHARVAATVDRRYFLYDRGMPAFLEEVMRGLSLPAHFRAITQAVNDRLLPGSRKGAGYILEALNAHPGCSRSDRGLYTLRAGV